MKTTVKNICSFLPLSLREKRSNLKVFGGGFLLLLLFSCTEENYITLPQPNKGKVNVYIEGSITNAEAQAKLDEEVGTITENIYVQNTTQLTEVIIKPVSNIRDIKVFNNNALKSLLIQGNGGKMNDMVIGNESDYLDTGHYLNSIVINGIVEANKFFIGFRANNNIPDEVVNIECNDLITLNSKLFVRKNPLQINKIKFNDLKYINKIFKSYNSSSNQIYGSYIVANEISMPNLEEIDNCYIVIPQFFSLPKLKKAKNIDLIYSLQSNGQEIELPLLNEVNILVITTSSTTPFTLVMPSLMICDKVYFYKNLPSATVNNILHQLLSLQQTSNKTIYLDAPNNQAPTGQGLIDKQSLINKGYNVLTN
jgi:hypothetical protein